MQIQANLTRPGMTQMQLEAASPVTPTYRAKIKILPLIRWPIGARPEGGLCSHFYG